VKLISTTFTPCTWVFGSFISGGGNERNNQSDGKFSFMDLSEAMNSERQGWGEEITFQVIINKKEFNFVNTLTNLLKI